MSRATPGYLYLMYAPLTTFHKIGVSSDPIRRTREVANASGLQVMLLSTVHVTDRETAERELHELFARYRVDHGEWFKLPDSVTRQVIAWMENKTDRS